jgi:hypothetical protein
MCSPFEVRPSHAIRSPVTAQRVAPLEISCIDNGAGSFLCGSGQVYIIASREIIMPVPANIYPGLRFDCVRLSVLLRSNSRAGRTFR